LNRKMVIREINI